MIILTQASREYSVTGVNLSEPLRAPWRAEIRVLTPATVAPPTVGEEATISDGTNTWTGIITDSQKDGGAYVCELSSGANLSQTVPPTYYAATIRAGEVLADLCLQAGEPAPEEQSATLPTWRTHGRSLRQELEALARLVSGGAWRMTPENRIAIAPFGWEEFAAPGKQSACGTGWITYFSGALASYAGRTVAGRRIERADTELVSGKLRTTLWQEVTDATAGIGTVEGATVKAQSGVRVDVETDRGVLMNGLPLWIGMPGASVKVTTGTRILVLDLAGDPRLTVAMLSPLDAPAAAETVIPGPVLLGDGTAPPVRYGDKVAIDGAGPAAALGTITMIIGQVPPDGGAPVGSKVRL